MSQIISPAWARVYAQAYGPPPKDCIVFDTETTGLSHDDVPVEIGHVVVRDGVIVQRDAVYLNWFACPRLIDSSWLCRQLHKTREHMWAKGSSYEIDPEVLQTRGENPVGVLQAYCELFRTNREAGGKLAGYNVARFDVGVMSRAFELLEDQAGVFRFNPEEIFDAGLLQKAFMLGTCPQRGERLGVFYSRVGRAFGKGLKWSLKETAQAYGLFEKHDLNVDLLHGAGYDAYVTQLLMEAQRSRFPQPETVEV